MFLKALDLLGAVVVTSASAMVIVVVVAYTYYLYKSTKEESIGNRIDKDGFLIPSECKCNSCIHSRGGTAIVDTLYCGLLFRTVDIDDMCNNYKAKK